MRRRRKRKKEKEKREEYLKQFFVFLAKSFVFLPRKKEHIKEIKGTPPSTVMPMVECSGHSIAAFE